MSPQRPSLPSLALALALALSQPACADDEAPRPASEGGGGGATGGGGEGGGGTAGGGGSSPFFGEERVYVHPLFETPEECEAAQQAGANCDQVVHFCVDGRAAIVVTDIVNPGTYAIEGASIATTWESGDVPEKIAFAQISGTELEDDAWGQRWILEPGAPGPMDCDP